MFNIFKKKETYEIAINGECTTDQVKSFIDAANAFGKVIKLRERDIIETKTNKVTGKVYCIILKALPARFGKFKEFLKLNGHDLDNIDGIYM